MSRALDEYHRKRDFDATPEPSGTRETRKAAAQALQFCIQKHDASHLHYDFRLELDGALKSWAIPKGPSLDPKARRLAVHVEDHPLDYARFEGQIPEGHYGAGEVIVWDRGLWIPEGDPHDGYARGKLKFRLQGEKLGGVWNLVKTHMQGKKEQWFLIKSKDDAARPETEYKVVEALPGSVLSERTLVPRETTSRPRAIEQAPAKKRRRSAKKDLVLEGAREADLPASLKPELATLVDSAPAGQWRYEIKFDGYRLLARIDGDSVHLFTRNGHDWTAKMPAQAKALAALGLRSGWLDGEAVVADERGVPNFQALQNAFETGKSDAIVYYLFDVPFLNGMDLREVPVEQRRAALAQLLKAHEGGVLRYSDDFPETPESLLDSACQLQMEGLIGKRVGSPYVSRRSGDWIKLKCKRRQEFVIVGYTEPKGSRSAFGALLLGLHDADSGELRYAGKVGTGFNETTLRTLHGQLVPLETHQVAVSNPPTGSEARGVHWLQPNLLAEVAFAEITREGSVRHAVFHGLRQDKPAKDISVETAKKPASAQPTKKARPQARQLEQLGGQVRITHPERVIDATSGTTKMQLAEYYARIAPRILPHLQGRPVALVRAPDGIAGELFFQKNAEHLAIPDITTFSKSEAGQAAMVIDNAQALIGAVQMSTVELHTWNATAKDFGHPDRFTLDLDPDPTLPWKSMVEATQLVLTVLDELGLKSFLKTSGGKGIHVVVPLTVKADWDEVKDFSHAIVKHIARLVPERFSAVSGPKNRVGRIFIDYLRNGLGATTICAYAARSRDGLPVSVPIWREELSEIKGADQWNIHSVFERLDGSDGDPWERFFKTRQSLTAALKKRLR
ncbi:DNA ligase D [Pseudomonas sp. dw_358]|uniref:DNA ligase D n=1 Tax=Pseudomonas sp. dw_358 TaxID=2720083 RepID=UPI001BD5B8C5|nr:DNA ligase D [Pseudomonas sp. dw_358]